MVNFISAKEAAEKWNISQWRVSVLCSENRIDGAMMVDTMWFIPSTAENPVDRRTERCEKQHAASLKPFVKWVGGKSQLLGELEKLLPASGEKKLTKYCEPMVGGGALFFSVLAKCIFEEWYISDSNTELINAYQIIKSGVGELIDAFYHKGFIQNATKRLCY